MPGCSGARVQTRVATNLPSPLTMVVLIMPADVKRLTIHALRPLGTVKDGKPYQADMGFGFHPFRREVAWHEAEATPLAELHARLAFTQEKNWGYRLRQGLIEISDADMIVIAEAMFTDQASAPQARASSIALPSRSTISPTWSSVTMNGGASSTWSPRVPSIVPPMG